MSEKLHSGLEQQIERFLAAHPDTVLIVIDTLQRIRGGVNDANPYASDYRDLGILKELADKHRIAILLIHHLRKMNDDDPMNMISGTTGISGATDTSFVLRKSKRSSNSATLYCMGRDIEYRELSLEFDFTGLVKCADCGSSLNVSYDKKRGRYTGFSCWVYKNYGKERCTSHAIGWKTLNQLVLEDIRRNAQVASLAAEDYMNMLVSMKTEKKSQEINRCKRELKKVEKRLGELEKILNKLYEDAALERISEERYQSMAASYEQEQEALKGQREALLTEITQGEEVYKNVERFLPLIQKYMDITELNAHILNELIEKIVVHEKQIDEDGIKSQEIDIYYKFIGYVNMRELLENGVWCGQDTIEERQKPVLIKPA